MPADTTETVVKTQSKAATINQLACPSYSLYADVPRRDEGSVEPCAVIEAS